MCVCGLMILLAFAPATEASPQTILSHVTPDTIAVYSGSVYDQESKGIAGVIVLVSSGGCCLQATTNINGCWGVAFCSAPSSNLHISYYWDSATCGPCLTTQTIPSTQHSVSETVNVWAIPVDIKVACEFPQGMPKSCIVNDTVGISMSSSETYTFSADASGSISDGFLKVGGSLESQITVCQSSYTCDVGYLPFYAEVTTGIAYRIVDTQGNSLEYVQPLSVTSLKFNDLCNDYMSITQACSEAKNTSTCPVIAIPHGTTNHIYQQKYDTSSTSIDHLSLGVCFPRFGSVKFSVTTSSSSSDSNSFYFKASYFGSVGEAYFIVWQGGIHEQGGPDLHVWYYGTNKPPICGQA